MKLNQKIYSSGSVEINIFDVLERYGEEELSHIFIWLDKRMESWSFTKSMASYFFCEMIKLIGEDYEYENEHELVEELKLIGAKFAKEA